MTNPLQSLITELYDALSADADFADKTTDELMIDFAIEDKGDLLTQINASLSRGTGLACIIDLVDGSDDAPSATVVCLNPVSIVLELSEKVLLNRQGTADWNYLTLRTALAMIIAKIKNFTYSDNTPLIFKSFRSVAPPKGADGAFQIYCDTTIQFQDN